MPLSRSEIEALLKQPLLGHLAVVKNGRPHVSPVWVLYDGGTVYFSIRTERLKGEAIQRNPSVAISVATDSSPYIAVLFEGQASVLKEGQWVVISKLVAKYVSSRYGAAVGDRLFASWKGQHDRVAYKVVPTIVLSWNYGRGDLAKQDEGVSMKSEM